MNRVTFFLGTIASSFIAVNVYDALRKHSEPAQSPSQIMVPMGRYSLRPCEGTGHAFGYNVTYQKVTKAVCEEDGKTYSIIASPAEPHVVIWSMIPQIMDIRNNECFTVNEANRGFTLTNC